MGTNRTSRGAPGSQICHECGRVDQGHMASASRVANGKDETRYFCHNDERSCYNDRRGRYFGNDYPERPELL